MKKQNTAPGSACDTGQDATIDTVIVEDKDGRRRFIRAGAAFLLAGGAAATTSSQAQEVAQEEEEFLRSDCDSVGGGGPKNAEMEGSDSDTGASADRPGCGRKKPVMTEYHKDGYKKVKVGKIIA